MNNIQDFNSDVSDENGTKPTFGSRFLSDLSDIKPCPFCGKKMPFGYYNAFSAYLGCEDCHCVVGSVRVCYKKEEIPEELKGLEEPADALAIKQEDGSLLHFPEHGYYGISCVVAFDHAGLLEKWNRRS